MNLQTIRQLEERTIAAVGTSEVDKWNTGAARCHYKWDDAVDAQWAAAVEAWYPTRAAKLDAQKASYDGVIDTIRNDVGFITCCAARWHGTTGTSTQENQLQSRNPQLLRLATVVTAVALTAAGCTSTTDSPEPAAATSEPAAAPSHKSPRSPTTESPPSWIPAEEHALDLADQLGWEAGIAELGFNYATLNIDVDPSDQQNPLVWRVIPTEHAQFTADGPIARQVDIDGHTADVIDEPDTLLYRVTCNDHIYEIDGYGHAPETVEDHMRQLVDATC